MNTTATKTAKKGINTSELGNAIKALDKLLTTPKTTTKVVSAPKAATKKAAAAPKVTYLAEGVTGKQMMRSIYDANNAHKINQGTFNKCLDNAKEVAPIELSKTIKGFDIADMTARNLIPLRRAGKTAADKWSVYEVLMLTKKYYQTK